MSLGEAESIVIVGRGISFTILFILYCLTARARALRNPAWQVWLVYIAVSLVRDMLRLLSLSGTLGAGFAGVAEYLSTAGLRILFVSAFLVFAGMMVHRRWEFWAAIGLSVADLVSDQAIAPIGGPSWHTQAIMLTVAALYIRVVWVGSRVAAVAKVNRIPCLLTGFGFALRYVIPTILEDAGLLGHPQAALLGLVTTSVLATLFLMCFINLNMMVLIAERAVYQKRAIDALNLASTYMERQGERPYRENGGCAGRAELAATTGVAAGQAR